MISNKEKNFISAIIYLKNEAELVIPFLELLNSTLDENFNKYEIICINDACRDESVAKLKEFANSKTNEVPITLVNMSTEQGKEACMNAGLDISIGDFIFEFDTLEILYSKNAIMDSYFKCLEGYDIVSIGPQKAKRLSSKLFYAIFNSASKSNYKLTTDVFHIVSRRAINRLHAINPNLPYRKAAFATSGLKIAYINCTAPDKKSRNNYRTGQALDALALYTNVAYKFSIMISMLLLFVTIFSAIYTIVVFVSKTAIIDGWFTTMMLMSGGFFGIFLILAIIIKYLSLLVDLIFKNQKYLVESIEKL